MRMVPTTEHSMMRGMSLMQDEWVWRRLWEKRGVGGSGDSLRRAKARMGTAA